MTDLAARALAALLGVTPAAQGIIGPEYKATVQRYAQGEREQAVAGLCAWPEKRVRDDVRVAAFAGRCIDCDPAFAWPGFPIAAALLIHGDCVLKPSVPERQRTVHESAALTLARAMSAYPKLEPLVRRWFQVMAGVLQSEHRWAEAVIWAELGVRTLPRAAELQLTLGSIEETLGAQAAIRDPSPEDGKPAGSRRLASEARTHLEKAEVALRAAVTADPANREARLRLGRVAWWLGNTAEARRLLEEVLARDPDAASAFLAQLFLGRVEEDAGNLPAAAQAYEAAIALDRLSQPAHVALSHLRLRMGEPRQARAEIETATRAGGSRPGPDALWQYPWGTSVGVRERLDELRREVSTP